MIMNLSSTTWKDSWKLLFDELRSHEPGEKCEKHSQEKIDKKLTELHALLAKVDRKIQKLEQAEEGFWAFLEFNLEVVPIIILWVK